jgi:hypothetical protein
MGGVLQWGFRRAALVLYDSHRSGFTARKGLAFQTRFRVFQ